MIKKTSLLGKKVAKKIAGSIYDGGRVTETLTNGYFMVDDKGNVRYWNKSAEKITGVSSRQMLGKNLQAQFAGTLPPIFYAVADNCLSRDKPFHFHEYWTEKKAWFDIITWYSENKVCVSFKKSDPADTSNPGQRLQTLTELYKFVTEITNDCLWEWDLKTQEIFWIDGGHKRVFGYPVENTLVPESFWKSCIHPDDKARVLAKLESVINRGIECIWEDEYRYKKADGNYITVCDRGHVLCNKEHKADRIIGATQDIHEKKLLEGELALEKTTQQRTVTAAILAAQEKERVSIGKELHDDLGQILAVAKLYMQQAQKTAVNRNASINKSLDLVTSAIKGIRKIAKALIIPEKHIISLADNIKILVADITAVNPVKIIFNPSGVAAEEINDGLQHTIFRIIQEQLNNVVTHSGASLATITLAKSGDKVLLNISDNGKGCDAVQDKNGVGIINIKSRVEQHEGSITIVSQPGKGYAIKAAFPLHP